MATQFFGQAKKTGFSFNGIARLASPWLFLSRFGPLGPSATGKKKKKDEEVAFAHCCRPRLRFPVLASDSFGGAETTMDHKLQPPARRFVFPWTGGSRIFSSVHPVTRRYGFSFDSASFEIAQHFPLPSTVTRMSR